MLSYLVQTFTTRSYQFIEVTGSVRCAFGASWAAPKGPHVGLASRSFQSDWWRRERRRLRLLRARHKALEPRGEAELAVRREKRWLTRWWRAGRLAQW